MAAFPKYHELICDTYTPNFTAGPTPCTLPSYPLVTKSRLQAGGTLFRSVQTGGAANVNNITLQCVVTPVSTVGFVVTENVDFTITDPFGVVYNIPTITQIYDGGSPEVCIQNGFSQLRTALNSNPVVDMPLDDTVGSGWTAAMNESFCLITAFGPTNMAGATVLPDGSGTIRTGPAYTLAHIVDAETGATGEVTTVDAISEWDGDQWVAHPSALYEPALDANGDVITPHPDCPNPTPI